MQTPILLFYFQEAYESSDACVEVPSRNNGGYHSVPSNTDTSGVDSDANAVLTDGSNDSSGTELLRLSSHGRPPRPGQKGKLGPKIIEENIIAS